MGRQNFFHQKQKFNMKSLIFLLGLAVLAAATEIEDPSEVGEFEEKEFDESEERELEESEEFEADEREFEERGVKNCHGFCNGANRMDNNPSLDESCLVFAPSPMIRSSL